MIYEAKEELEQGIRPELKAYPDLSPYDTVFLGFPNWWNTLPMPVVSCLERCDWHGKWVLPFVTSGGGGFGDGIQALQKLCNGAVLSENGSAFLGHQVETSREAIMTWAKAAL